MENIYHKRNNSVDAIIYANNTSFWQLTKDYFMRYALHGMCSLHNNIVSDIRLAKETGYDGLEIHTEKLWRYINAGLTSPSPKNKVE